MSFTLELQQYNTVYGVGYHGFFGRLNKKSRCPSPWKIYGYAPETYYVYKIKPNLNMLLEFYWQVHR